LDGIQNPAVREERKKAVQNIQVLKDRVLIVKDTIQATIKTVNQQSEENRKREEQKKRISLQTVNQVPLRNSPHTNQVVRNTDSLHNLTILQEKKEAVPRTQVVRNLILFTT
jgi:hypothetical protein